MAASHRGPWCCQGCPGHVPPPAPARPPQPKGPPAPSKALSPHPARTWLVLTQQHEAEGCSDPLSQRAVGEQGGNSSDLPPKNLGREDREDQANPRPQPETLPPNGRTAGMQTNSSISSSSSSPGRAAELGFGCWRT